MSEYILKTEHLHKSFDQVHALRDINLQIPKGEIVALLGANGAGKSTFLQIVSALLSPTSGNVHVLGMDVEKETLAIKKRIGLLFGNQSGLYHRLTAYENIAYVADFYGVDQKDCYQRIQEWAKRLDLTPHLNKKADGLSQGNQQKVSILRSIIHDPELIYFDEPTTGLDIAASLTFLDLVQELHNRGKSILFSTHILEEVTTIATHVIILQQGRVFFQGSLQDLYRQYENKNLTDIMRHVIGGRKE